MGKPAFLADIKGLKGGNALKKSKHLTNKHEPKKSSRTALMDALKGGVKLRKRVHEKVHVSKSAPVDESNPMAAIKARRKKRNFSGSESSDDSVKGKKHPNSWSSENDVDDSDRRRMISRTPMHSKCRDSPVMI